MRSLKLLASLASSLGCAASLLVCSQSFAQTTQPIQVNDLVYGLSRANAAETVQHVRGNPVPVNGGTKLGSTWSAPFVQSLQFDNYDGIGHGFDGNLIGNDFGTATNGFQLYNMETRRTPGALTPGAAQKIFDFASYNAANPGSPLAIVRSGSVSVSPKNDHLVVTGYNAATGAGGTIGFVTVLDYNAGATPGTGTGASVSNGRQLTGVVQSGSTSNTSGTTWLDNDNFLTLQHPVNNNPNAPATGTLKKVTIGAGGALTASDVSTVDFPGGTAAFSSMAYQPTISPYVYVGLSQFPAGALANTQNRLYILDPNNSFASVGSFDYSTSMNTAREIAFDSKGNLYWSEFGNTTSVPFGGSIDVILTANQISSLSNNNSHKYYTQDQSGGSLTAFSAQFSGIDVANSILDYKTAGVTANVRARTLAVPYFPGVVNDPKLEIRARLLTGRNGGAWNGTGSAIISSNAAAANPQNTAIGYAQNTDIFPGGVGSWGGMTFAAGEKAILMKYTYYGDTDLNGVVNFDDYSRTDNGFANGGNDWFHGDFDYNGVVDFDDYSLIDNAFNTQSGTLRRAMSYLGGDDRSANGMDAPALQFVMQHFDQFGQPYANAFLNAVPEPASLSVFGLIAAAALARRRRN